MSVIKFELNNKSYGLYFGMVSTRIFQEKSAAEYLRLQASGIKEPGKDDFDPYLTFAFVIHSGLCNMADITTEQRPDFIDSYSLSETIYKDDDLCRKINATWNESQPVKDMLDKLNNAISSQKKSKVKPIGKKSSPMPSGI